MQNVSKLLFGSGELNAIVQNIVDFYNSIFYFISFAVGILRVSLNAATATFSSLWPETTVVLVRGTPINGYITGYV